MSRADEVDGAGGTEIIVLCDGTGKNGHIDHDPTNVFLLREFLTSRQYPGPSLTNEALCIRRPSKTPTIPDGTNSTRRRKRVQLYIPGVGAESKGIPKYLALVFWKDNCRDGHQSVHVHCGKNKPGDVVCIFGYSRGAFVARKVAGLLDLITPQCSVPVKCLGVWDTVGEPSVSAFGEIAVLSYNSGAIYSSPDCEEKDLLGMPDSELPPNVKLALHVLAYHENRKRFRPYVRQIWFPGAHSDVGGGGEKPTDLPKISLIWMVGELRGFMDIPDDEKKLKYPLLNNLEPSDAYNDSPAWKRAVDKFETRLDSKALQPTAKVHQTLRDIKQEMKRAHGTHRQLTFSDLLALKWNIQTGLVQCNTLERLKQSLSVVSGWHRYEAYRLITISGRSNIQRTTTERSYKSFVNAALY
ncbi:hypothetical protein RHS01_02252 [Rhizoctonia solani]|uniref:T6SS Phospholipase effector Tle1-like catalytic domain-containing protein n=1 Tax=Rhizoctonia solani TaxID=456999 RepID=A0A8H7M833_9AGAM|nr:hypothetical protein RHS01_02252 [Rhizoctonia solani]